MLKKRYAIVLPALISASTGAMAQTAAAADYSTLTAAVNWSSAITALMAVGGVIAGVLVIRKGINYVLRSLS